MDTLDAHIAREMYKLLYNGAPKTVHGTKLNIKISSTSDHK